MFAKPVGASVKTPEPAPLIKIQFFGSIRESAGKTSDEMHLAPDTNVSGLMRMLSEAYGNGVRGELLDENSPGGLRDDLMVTVNESIINHDKAADITVNPGDVIALYPTFPGGG